MKHQQFYPQQSAKNKLYLYIQNYRQLIDKSKNFIVIKWQIPKVKKTAIISLIGICVVSVFLVSRIHNSDERAEKIQETIRVQNIQTLLTGKHLVAFVNQGSLSLVDTTHPDPVTIYNFQTDEQPANPDITEVKINNTKKYVVWYSARKGFIALDLSSLTTKVLKEANNWLNKNPYFEFSAAGDAIYFVDKEGTTFVKINLATSQLQESKIPEPFGNVFRVSPDEKHIIYISGFGQSQKPLFMFTDIESKNPHLFSVESPVNKRFLVAWKPDSSGVLVVENDHQISFVPHDNSTSREVFYKVEDDVSITELIIQNELVYLAGTDQKWRAIDPETKQLKIRVPVDLAEGIHRPRFIPWFDNTFLIEETLRMSPNEHRRLWVTTTMGVKKKIIEKYRETTFEDVTPEI